MPKSKSKPEPAPSQSAEAATPPSPESHQSPSSHNSHAARSASAPESLPTDQPKKHKGKIAELSKEHRLAINQLLENGATYKTVAAEMAKHGITLNGENLSNWFNGGFQDYLRHQTWLTQIRTLHEDATDLIDGAQVLKFHQAANYLAATQIFKALKSEQYNDDPMNYTRILNAFSRLSRGALTFKQYEDNCARAEAAATAKTAARDPRRDLENNERDLWWNCVQGVFGFKPDRQIGPTLPELMNLSTDRSTAERPSPNGPVLPNVTLSPDRGTQPEIGPERPVPEDAPANAQPATSPAHDAPSSQGQAPASPDIENLHPSTNPESFRDCNLQPTSAPSPESIKPVFPPCPHCSAKLPRRLPNGTLPCAICPECRQPLPDDI